MTAVAPAGSGPTGPGGPTHPTPTHPKQPDPPPPPRWLVFLRDFAAVAAVLITDDDLPKPPPRPWPPAPKAV